MNRRIITMSCGILMLAAGCTTYAPQYTISSENMISLKEVKGGNKIQLGNFTSYKSDLHAIGCRGVGPVSTPNDQPFEQYVKRAMEGELRASDLYGSAGSVEVNGHLQKILMSSNIGVARWEITMNFSSPGKESFVVDVVHKVNNAWNGQQACFFVAQGFPSAVRELLYMTFKHPIFKSWLSR